MDIASLKELIEAVDKSSLAYFEVKNNEIFIKMDKSLNRGIEATKEVSIDEEKRCDKVEIVNTLEQVVVNEKAETTEISDATNGEFVTSPMVGTFYISPSPDKDAFVKVGDKVKAGSVLCIIEAMKLMNEIECEWNGEVIEILVKDGEMVEYGQPLFKIKR